jgi:hypothetical protein
LHGRHQAHFVAGSHVYGAAGDLIELRVLQLPTLGE